MKKWIVLILSVVLVLCFAACGANHAESSQNNTDSTSVTEDHADKKVDTDAGNSHILIAYFSMPENVDISGVDAVAEFRPTLAASVENFEQYEYVFLGYPNWWADLPMAVYSFLEEYDFGAKTIIPFITHGGSGASNTIETISQLQPGALMMGNELILSRGDVAESEEMVVAWAQGLGIHAKAELPDSQGIPWRGRLLLKN